MPLDQIIVRGAREHNLKNIDVHIPRDKLVVITGVSGSGKSSLAFDTIYAEGQRRYVESLSAYARQFLGLMEKPDVDYIDGLSPAISIDQKGASRNPRSTVATQTEIYDYMRLLYARVGHPHCPECGRPIVRQTVQQIVDAILATPAGRRLMILAPVIKDRKGEYTRVFEDARKAGFVRVRVDGQVRDLDEDITLDKNKRHTIEVVIDRLVTAAPVEGEEDSQRMRISDSVETALRLGAGTVMVGQLEDKKNKIEPEERMYSEAFACVFCGVSYGELEPRNFSFNSPHGACRECTGLGVKMEMDPTLVIQNRSLSVAEGAIVPWSRTSSVSTWYMRMLNALARKHGFDLNTPVKDMKPEHLNLVLYGDKGEITINYTGHGGHDNRWNTTFEGVIPNLTRRYKDTDSDYVRNEIGKYMAEVPCTACGGARLKPESLAVTVDGRNISQVASMSIAEALTVFTALREDDSPLTERERTIANQILKEIYERLRFLSDVGVDYLTLDRRTGSLAGGEAHRIRLATQIGSSLMGVLYVCDEPSIGLHPADDDRLIATLIRLRDLGNTVLVVEHDEAMMRAADWVVDLGPRAGAEGGHVIAEGPLDVILKSKESSTGAYLSGRKQITVPAERREGNGKEIIIRGARANNLKDIDVNIPLGMFVCVTGVSGSGKSTLVSDILSRKAAQILYNARERPGEADEIVGFKWLDKVVTIDQSPIGRTPRSNPATYTGTFTPIRELFASVPESRLRGYKAGRFSFNVKGGRCEACQGDGYIQIEMQFLPDVEVPCEVCHGARYNREALEIHYKGKNIAEVLDMTVAEGVEFFDAIPRVRNKLETLNDVGLGYIKLGQPATTLSGGEAQRVKLATELSRRATGRTLYILDEPTTGLSFEDVNALMGVLHRLVDTGNTVLVIEHHIDVVKQADHIIDLGPLGGDRGGEIVAQGTPEQVARTPGSLTGKYLRKALERGGEAKNGARANGRKPAAAKAKAKSKSAKAKAEATGG
ncbi:MAG TPA: excinuclease ABC subunit UvrA [Dehalococcoidia bacterium]|nr:excinuclease ABC subunit UvrA [Dehalococcoidia bacterium]